MILAEGTTAIQRIAEGKGVYITAVGMGVVLFGLSMLAIIITIAMKFMSNSKERKSRKEIFKRISNFTLRRQTYEIPYGADNTAEVSDEVIAAISLALNQYFTMYENPDEMAVLTKISKISPTTPWVLYHRSGSMRKRVSRLKK